MSGPLFPETETVSDVNVVGLVHDAIHDRGGHDHHKRQAKTRTATVMRQLSRFPRRASWWSESCNGLSRSILSSISLAIRSDLPDSDARACDVSSVGLVTSRCGASIDNDYLIVRSWIKARRYSQVVTATD
jgi:hypothetical protein